MDKFHVIDVKSGNLTGDKDSDLIILKGKKTEDKGEVFHNIQLIVQDGKENKQYLFDINEEGINLSLFIGDFNRDGKDEIFIIGESSSGSIIGKVIELFEGNFRVIFNVDNFEEDYKYICQYIDNYLVKVFSEKSKLDFNFYIGNINENYINSIYNNAGKVKCGEKPSVSKVNDVYPIENIVSGNIELVLRQSILGIGKGKFIGDIETRVAFKNNICNLISQVGITFGEEKTPEEITDKKLEIESIKKLIGRNITLLNLERYNIKEKVIVRDFDNDGKDEILCCYSNNSKVVLSVLKKDKDNLLLLDTIEFSEEIKDLIITPIRRKEIINIIIGFKKSSINNGLKILELKNNKLKNLIKEDDIVYSKLEVEKLDIEKKGVFEIALWNHIAGEAYDITILSHFGSGIQSTNRYDKYYYPKVESYYRDLIERTRETPTYLYYLADSLLRCGNKKDALIYIDRVINSIKPYPSLEDAKKFKRKIIGNTK